MLISRLLKSIKVGLRSKLFVCAATILAGYSYCYAGNPLFKLVAIVILFISAEAMILLWGSFFLGNLIENMKTIFKAGKSISWIEIPEFKELAKQMGVKLHQKRPFGIKQGLNNAYAIPLPLFRQIIFGEDLIQRLGTLERLALASHELTHLKQDHYGKTLMWSILIILLVAISLSFAPAPTIVKNVTCVAAFLITFVFVSHQNEYAADAGASAQVGKEPTISLLQNIVPAEKWRSESETHPSIQDRISKLQKM